MATFKASGYKNNAIKPNITWQQEIARMRAELWKWLKETGGLQIPLKPITEKREDFYNKGLY